MSDGERDTAAGLVLQWAARLRGVVLALAAGLVLLGYNGQWRIGPDSSVHVTVARSLAAGEGFAHPGGRAGELEPGLPYLLAGVFRAFGPDAFHVANGVMAGIAVLTLLATYALLAAYGGRGLAAVVVLLLAVNETFYRYAHQLLTDMPFLLGAVLALLGLELGRGGMSPVPSGEGGRPSGGMRRASRDSRGPGTGNPEAPSPPAPLPEGEGSPTGWRVALGLACVAAGLAVMAAFRSVAAVFVGALAVGAVGRLVAWRHRWRWPVVGVAAVGGIGVAAWLAVGSGGMDAHVIGVRLGRELGGTLAAAFTTNLANLLGEATTESALGVDMHPVLAAPLAVYLLALCVGLGVGGAPAARRPLWALLFVAFVLQWLLFVVADRYLLPLLPLVALAWWRGAVWWSGRVRARGRAWEWGVLALVLALWLVPNGIKVGDFVRGQWRRPFLRHYEKGKYEPIVALGQWAKANTAPGAVFVTPVWMSAQLTAVSGRWATPAAQGPRAAQWPRGAEVYLVPPLPEKEMDRLRRRGWAAVSDEPYAPGATAPPVPVLRLIAVE